MTKHRLEITTDHEQSSNASLKRNCIDAALAVACFAIVYAAVFASPSPTSAPTIHRATPWVMSAANANGT